MKGKNFYSGTILINECKPEKFTPCMNGNQID